ncbi:hypothetical protein ABZV60_36165, partial [Streptomyces sp. NPDC004787]|uniref:hypothetical protein n=1 Tax=Streptomyces sp. NPDC004787 TaxID=3154291 RepID=UPI00339F2DBB
MVSECLLDGDALRRVPVPGFLSGGVQCRKAILFGLGLVSLGESPVVDEAGRDSGEGEEVLGLALVA